MCTGNKVEAAVVARGVVEGNPDADGVTRRKRPVRVVEMPPGGVCPGLLDESLVVPDADSVGVEEVVDDDETLFSDSGRSVRR
jgi:hypothetical protein